MKMIQAYQNPGRPGEPVFVVMGRQKHGAAMLHKLADLMAADGDDPEQIRIVREHAFETAGYDKKDPESDLFVEAEAIDEEEPAEA